MDWMLADGACPLTRQWGDEFVVYHALSNDTHRLASAAGRILETLMQAQRPLDIERLSTSGLSSDAVEEALAALVDLGFAVCNH